jgi:hypothetical protein
VARDVMPEIPILPNAYEGIPQIDRSRIPAAQMAAFLHLSQLLAELGLYERRLLLAVYLYQYAQTAGWELRNDWKRMEFSLWTTGGWQQIAARDGALTIYHFGRAIEGLRESFGACPALSSQVDHHKIRRAYKDSNQPSRTFIEIRAAVAHVADFSGTTQKKFFHSVKGIFKAKWFSSNNPAGITWLAGNMNDHTFAVTLEGKAYTYDLSLQSAERIREIKLQIFSAFDAATNSKPAT